MPAGSPEGRSGPLGGEVGRTGLRAVLVAAQVLVACVIALAALEGTLALAMRPLPSPTWRRTVQDYHVLWERRIVQFLPECAQYDDELTYTLRPGGCRFKGREFSVDLRVNSQGFRADEEALNSASVIVIGDSYTMGWGIADDQTFASLVEQRTGLKTLNGGMSSYGTARELLALRRVNLSRARYLIIQYCDNDFKENVEYVKGGDGRLTVLTRAQYDSVASEHLRVTAYYPGKYLHLLPPMFRDRWLQRDAPTLPARDHEGQAKAFLQVLTSSPVPLENLKIVAFELMPRARNDSSFVTHLREEMRRGNYPRWIREITALDMSRYLSEADYFFYDDHINASGHAKVAALLVQAIEASEAGAAATPPARSQGRAPAATTGSARSRSASR